MQDTWVPSLGWENILWAFQMALVVKKLPANAGDPNLIPETGSSPRERIGYPLQYSWASLVAQTIKNPPAMWET